MLNKLLTAYEYAAEDIEEQYCDEHKIVMRNIADNLQTTLQSIWDLARVFDNYLKTRDDRPGPDVGKGDLSEDRVLPGWQSLAIDIDAVGERADEMMVGDIVFQWVTAAKDKANVDILAEKGEHEKLLWKHSARRWR